MPKTGLVADRRPEAGRRPPVSGRPPPAGAWSPSAKSNEGVKVEKNTKSPIGLRGINCADR